MPKPTEKNFINFDQKKKKHTVFKFSNGVKHEQKRTSLILNSLY